MTPETPTLQRPEQPPKSAPEPSKWRREYAPIVIVGVGIAVCAVLVGTGREKPAPPSAPADASVVSVSKTGQDVAGIQTEPVALASLDDTIVATGQLTFPSDETVKIAPKLTGAVKQIFVQVGDHVRAGQPVAVLASADAAGAQATEAQNLANLRLAKSALERTQIQYRLGTPEVTSAQATLDQARANAQSDKAALEKITEQAAIGGFTQSPLESAKNSVVAAQSSLTQSQADLDTAQRAYDRMVKLVDLGVNSRADLENASNALAHANANVEANRQLLEIANEALAREQKAFKSSLYSDQALITAQNNYQQAVLQEQAAERALRIAKAAILADLQQAQNAYQNAVAAESSSRNALALLGEPTTTGLVTITSPIDGVVVERDVSPGQVVDQSQMTPWQLMVVSADDKVWMQGDVYETDIAAVHAGQPISISVDAYPNRTFAGKVVRIAPTLNQNTRAVSVRTEISNPGGLLKSGMFAEMTIDAGGSRREPVIPLSAVQHDQDTDYVYVAQGGKYVRRNVRLGARKADRCAVAAGLKPGARVVTQGALLLGGQVESD